MTASTLAQMPVKESGVATPPWRVAIVGCGPRGMYCLERLVAAIRRTPTHRPVIVTIYDPTERLGAGPVYDERTPDYLRMNFASRQVDARPSDDPANPSALLSLTDWLAEFAPEHADPHGYAPRALVGRYLNWCFGQIVSTLPPEIQVEHSPQAVRRLDRVGRQWSVGEGRSDALFDEVVLTVGHEGWRAISDASATQSWPGAHLPQLSRLFPIDQRLDEAAPPGSTVVTRGFALTWIDACLALTEGRGGRFVVEGEHCRYIASGAEPARILPWSRTGRPMWAKVDQRKVEMPALLADIWQEHAVMLQRVRGQLAPGDFRAEVWPVVVAAADAALGRLGKSGGAPAWYRNWQKLPATATGVHQAMLHGYLTATGRRPFDQPWALGEAWRQLYPAIVDWVSHGGLASDAEAGFRQIAREMERIAFGPPAENVGRILALIEAGIVDLTLLGRPADSVYRHGDSQTPAVALETRIPGPGDVQPGSITAHLLQEGYLRRQNGTGGIVVDHAGRPLDESNQPIDRIAVLGRMTEGVVLGNDTLSRRLHLHPSRWAEAVVRRLVREEAAAGLPNQRKRPTPTWNLAHGRRP